MRRLVPPPIPMGFPSTPILRSPPISSQFLGPTPGLPTVVRRTGREQWTDRGWGNRTVGNESELLVPNIHDLSFTNCVRDLLF